VCALGPADVWLERNGVGDRPRRIAPSVVVADA
jgi:hypothetical protein